MTKFGIEAVDGAIYTLANLTKVKTNLYPNPDETINSIGKVIFIDTKDIFANYINKEILISIDLKCEIARPISVYAYQKRGISINITQDNPKIFTVTTPNIYERFTFSTTIKDWGLMPEGYTLGEIIFYDSVSAQNFSISNINLEIEEIATTQDGAIVKVADNISAMTKTLYETFTNDTNIMNICDERFGLQPRLLKYDTDINKTYLAIRHKCISKSNPVILQKSYDLNYNYILGIKNFEINVEKIEGDIVKIIFSVDDGLTWIAFNGTDWVPLVDITWNTILMQGMNTEAVVALNGTQLDVLFSTKKIKVGILLKPINTSSTLRLNNFKCNYIIKEVL